MSEESFKLGEGAKKLLNNVWSTSSYSSVQALTDTLNKKVLLKSSGIRVGSLREIPKLLNPNRTAIAVVTITFEGAIAGVMFVSAKQKDMLAFADILLRKPIGTSKNLDETNLSVIRELGNLLSGYYVEAFIKLIDARVHTQKPLVGFNEYRVIEKTGFGNIYKQEIDVLMFETEFAIEEGGFKAEVLVLFNEESSEHIYTRVLKQV